MQYLFGITIISIVNGLFAYSKFAIVLTNAPGTLAYICEVRRTNHHNNVSNQMICSFQEFAPFCHALYYIASFKQFAC